MVRLLYNELVVRESMHREPRIKIRITMNKYIDVEKLIAEIKNFSSKEYGDNTFGDDIVNGALDYVIEEIIPSLQQEQPKIDLEKEIEEHVYNMPHCEFSHYTQDLEDEDWARAEFRYFYELGLKARKEE